MGLSCFLGEKQRQGVCFMEQEFIGFVKLCGFFSVLKDYYIYQY